jgi:WD40 repeat protein
VAWSADAHYALSGSDDGTLRWRDLAAGTSRPLEGHTHAVYAVAQSADGRYALSGSDDKTLRWWDLATGRCLCVFPCEAWLLDVALAWDNGPVAAGGLSNGRVQFFRIEPR